MKRALLVVTVMLVGLLASPAFAQYGGSSTDVTIKDADGNSTNQLKAAEDGTLTADNLVPNTDHDINFSQSPAVKIGSGTSNSNGVMKATFTIPATAHTGAATLEINPVGVTGSNKTVSIEIVSSGGVGLPTTGRDIARMTVIGLSLLIFGGLLTVVTRRRRARPPSKSEELVSSGY